MGRGVTLERTRRPGAISVRRWAVGSLPSFLHPLAREAVLAGTGIVGSVLRSLPGDSTTLGPPRRFAATLSEYGARHPERAQYRELYPAHDLWRAPPAHLEPQRDSNFDSEFHRRAWAGGLGVMPRGRVVASSGAVIAADDTLIYDVSHTAASDDPRRHPIFLTRKLPPMTRIGGSVAVLTTYTSNVPNMFYFVHWLLDTLPRLHLIEKSGVAWDWVVAPQATRFHRETLSLLGVASERILSDRNLHIEAERLVVPTLPGLPVNPPRWVCDYLRDKFLPLALDPDARPLRPGRRLYLSRAKARTRHVANESELVASLARRGFERVFLEDYPFLEQVRMMQESEAVVAPHGASNASLVFCRPGTVFVEMFSPRYVNVCYWSLCNEVGVRYGYVVGDGRPGGRQAHEAIAAPTAKLDRLLDRLCCETKAA